MKARRPDPDEAQRSAMLSQIERLARGLMGGLDADGDGEVDFVEAECALQQTAWILEPLRFERSDL